MHTAWHLWPTNLLATGCHPFCCLPREWAASLLIWSPCNHGKGPDTVFGRLSDLLRHLSSFRGHWKECITATACTKAGLIHRPEYSTCPFFLQPLLTPNGPLVIINKMHSPAVSGSSIRLPYLQDRLTSAQNLPRNEGDKEELLWLFSKARFFLPVLSLRLVKLVWTAYQGSRERHQSAWFSSVVSCVSGAAGTWLLPPPPHSITYTLLGSCCTPLPSAGAAWGPRLRFTSHFQLDLQSHVLLPTEKIKQDVTLKDTYI